jgi:hypothetical protein
MTDRSGRETVGVFHDTVSFQDAVDDLLLQGFDRSLLSLMADETTVARASGRLIGNSDAAADDPAVPRVPFIGTRSRSTMRAMTISTLGSVGACAVAGGVAASGGTVVLALAAGAAVGGASGALGAAVGRLMNRRHTRYLLRQVERGGILLWVATPTAERELLADRILRRHGADHVHSHDLPVAEISRRGGVSESLAWINKPLLGRFLQTTPPRPGSNSTVH